MRSTSTPWAGSGQWHACASVQLGAGEGVVTLARRLGHSSPAITLGYYAHFTPEAGSKRWSVMDCKVEEMGGLGNC
ncbi:integrase [Streptomyces nodosus]|uniref:Integrase n=1 Tax=Streptomyces nodosus TaxID=40318 RepID=A0A5P2W1V1_9ACTN|nr:integrase [Streptomyces nodosus]